MRETEKVTSTNISKKEKDQKTDDKDNYYAKKSWDMGIEMWGNTFF